MPSVFLVLKSDRISLLVKSSPANSVLSRFRKTPSFRVTYLSRQTRRSISETFPNKMHTSHSVFARPEYVSVVKLGLNGFGGELPLNADRVAVRHCIPGSEVDRRTTPFRNVARPGHCGESCVRSWNYCANFCVSLCPVLRPYEKRKPTMVLSIFQKLGSPPDQSGLQAG
jgi:hypothetical protein